ncbi:MAG: hypothetical protein JW751_07710 [Polyangiaceae bacterium]|nr:hypothetical protein [Polyangiaceae bacterium]
MRRRTSLAMSAGGVIGALLLGVGCGGSDSEASGPPGILYTGGTSGFLPVGTGGRAGTAGGGTGGTLPPEAELEGSFEAPIVTGKYLWSANPQSGRVALVDAETLRVTTVESGFGPRYLAAIPTADPEDAATIVLNELGEDATLLTLVDGVIAEPVRFSTHAQANSLAVSPSGRWVVAWSDWREFNHLDPTDSFQDLTLILVTPSSGDPCATRRVAGYRPSSVTFDADEQNLLVVSEHGVTVIDLTDEANPEVRALVEVAAGGLADAAARDVVVTPDGSHAIVRHDDSNVLGFVDLATAVITDVTLDGRVTDLDVADEGATAVAVMRGIGQVAVLDLPEAITDPEHIHTTSLPRSFGSVSLAPDASVGVLYTNAEPTTVVAKLSLSDDETFLDVETEDLRAPVRAVLVAPDAEHAVALLDPPSGSVKAGAFSIIPTFAPRGPKIVGTDAPAMAVAIAPAPSTEALVTTRDDVTRTYGVHVIALPSLQEDYLPLVSPPLAVGLIPELGKGFVAQEHPEGRITFIDFPTNLPSGSAATPTARTLTGFELAARVTYPADN